MNGEAIPTEAVSLMAKLGIPGFLYVWMGNRGWKQEAKQRAITKEMYNKPFKA
jgi:hypothetical protein